jgi:gliding motility-associated-like protein
MRSTLTTLLLFLGGILPAAVQAAAAPGSLEFIENRGQWDGRVRYAAQVATGARLFVEPTGLTYALTAGLPDHHAPVGAKSPAPLPGGQVPAHGLRVEFVGAEFGATLRADAASEIAGRRHYLRGAEPAGWGAEARAWRQLRYQGLWPGTDLILKESRGQQLEYDLLLAPGADAARPVLRYRGAMALRLDPATGSLLVQTSVGQLSEHRPQAWQLDPATGRQQPVACAFRLHGEDVSFELGRYDHARPLIIDPVVEFASYTGSAVENWGFASTYDDAGNLYTAGVVFEAGYPVTTGAYQVAFGGSTDIAVMKFNAGVTGPGARAWATYLGGNNLEFPHSLLVNGRGELLLLGTTSSTNYPTTAPALSRTFGGGSSIAPFGINSPFALNGSDLVLTRLRANGGGLQASTYLGGSGNDGLLDPAAAAPRLRHNYGDSFRGDLALDAQGNVYVASVTASANFPGLAAGAYRGGDTDALVTSLDSSLSRVRWTTPLGGAGADAAYSLQRDDATGALLVAGGTTSSNFGGTASGYQAAAGGGVDGFVARLTPAGALSTATYLGAAGYDQAYFVRQGPGGSVYVLGQTLSAAWPGLDPSCYTNANGRQFIQQLGSTLTGAGFATVFGSGRATTDISPTAFEVNCYGQLLLAGWGGGLDPNNGSTMDLPTTPNALQSTTDGMDFYLMQLSDQAKVLDYATFFGSGADDHVDGGTSRFSPQSILYQAMCACNDGLSQGIPVPAGAHYYAANNGALKCNNAAFKLAFRGGSSAAGADTLTVCALMAPLRLGGSPAGGTWAGTGVTGNTTAGFVFTPSAAVLGTHLLTYTSPLTGLCAGTSTRRITVLPQVRASLSAPNRIICLLPQGPAPALIPLTGTPVGGIFSGRGVVAGTVPGTAFFDPLLAGRGIHIVRYLLAGGRCPVQDFLTITVEGIPPHEPTQPRRICANDPPVPLMGTPPGGVWTGTGVTGTVATGYVFTPSAAIIGSHLLRYSFPGDRNCPGINDSIRMIVRPVTGMVQVPADTTVCPTSARFQLGGGNPAGGTWAGSGVSGSVATGFWFTPSPMLIGSQSVSYTGPPQLPVNDCPGMAVRNITVRAPAPVQLVPLDSVLCSIAGPQTLAATPAGGVWSGPGVSGTVAGGFTFTPSAALAGYQTLTYLAPPPTDPSECQSAGEQRLRVVAVPQVFLSPLGPISFCLAAPPHGVVLNAVPAGGVFGGPGVVGNRFSPSLAGAGRHTLTYTYEMPGLNCPIVSSQTVDVSLVAAASLPSDTVLCAEQSPFQLRATPAGGVWAGPGVTASGWFTPPASPGTSVLSYTLPGGCVGQTCRVTVPDQPTFAAAWQEPACANQIAPRVLQFKATGPAAARVRWDFGDGSPVVTGASVEHAYTTPGNFQPQAQIGSGSGIGLCPSQAVLAPVAVEAALVPNIITPNADGLNDTFTLRVGGCPGRLQVFSRWGQLVFEQADYHNTWAGEDLPAGLYYFLLSPSEGAARVKGWVEVVR